MSQLAGTVILTAHNTYSGGTDIANGATLQIGNNGTTGALGSGPVVDNGTLAFNRSDGVVIANLITGTGGFSLLTGSVTLAADNTYLGGTTIAPGAYLQIGSGGTTGRFGIGAVVDNGTLAFNRSDTITLADAISGTGTISQLAGTVILTGDNLFAGNVNIAAGATLQLGNGGTSGSLAAAASISNGGVLAVNHSGTLLLSTLISGVGTLSALAGTTVLTGANTFSGGTSIAPGAILQIGNGGTSGSVGTGPVANGGALVFSRSDSITMPNLMTGAGSVSRSSRARLF